MADTAEPPVKKQKLESIELENLEVLNPNTVSDDFSQDVDTPDAVVKSFVVSDDKYNNFVSPAELDRLREFRVLDEVKSNDEESNDEESDSSDGKSEGVPEEELDKMLDEDLPEDFKAAPKPKEKAYITRQKIVLEEKGINQFEILPLDWMMARHYSGMPIYMHRPTRVCTLSKPYFLGKGNTRRHDIPISALPCLAYRRALEEEAKQKAIDKQIDDQIKSGMWQQNKDKSKANIHINNNKINDNSNSVTKTEPATVRVTNDTKEAKKRKCPFSNESFVSEKNDVLNTVSNSFEVFQNGIKDDVALNIEIDNIGDNFERDKLTTGIAVVESMENNLEGNEINTLTCAEDDATDKHIDNKSTENPHKAEESNVVEDNVVTIITKEDETTESNNKQENFSKINYTDLNSTTTVVEVNVNTTETKEVETTESNKQDNNSEINDIHLNATSTVVEVNVDTKEAETTESIENQNNNNNNSEINQTDLNSTSTAVEVNVDTNETEEPETIKLKDKQDNNNSEINHEDLNSTELNSEVTSELKNDEEYAEIPLNRQPVVLPGGIVMPPPRVETVSTSWKTQHLTYEQVNEYCRRLFKFKTVNIMHFKRWADRRKYTKARKTLQYPTLPEGTKLITIPAQPAAGQDANGGKVNKRDWVMNMNGRSYLSVFHEYVRRALQKQPVYEFKQLENASTPYQATVYIGGMQYGVGRGSSKRAAKSAAARASIHILIPEMRSELEPRAPGAPPQPAQETDFTFFDYVGIEDPRITEFCSSTCEPSPHATLRTCLLRNFGAGDRHIHTEMKKLEYQKMELTMKVGKHTATVVCKNKKTAKQRASQAILQALHPHVRSWGSLLRLYGSRSVKSCKEKKMEEQQITLLQDAARHNEPNYAVLEKLRHEMRKLRERDEAVVAIGTLLVKDDLPTHSGSNLNNVDL